jgi:hypothetical protein
MLGWICCLDHVTLASRDKVSLEALQGGGCGRGCSSLDLKNQMRESAGQLSVRI